MGVRGDERRIVRPRVAFDLKLIEVSAIKRFRMNQDGIHGVAHWKRVLENGRYLGKHGEANLRVVEAFALLHDCCRESDGLDRDHGRRAAEFAAALDREILGLNGEERELLCFACENHEKGRTTEDLTVGVCWDSDRLDLGRVGIVPNPKYLSTERARRKSVIDWAYARSRGKRAKLKGG